MTAPFLHTPRALTSRIALSLCALLASLLSNAAPAAPAAATAPTTRPAATTQPFRPSLFAYGSSSQYWIAHVEPYRDGARSLFKTLVRRQTLPAGDWKDLGVVYGHATALAEVQGELAVLLEDGSWKRLGESGLSTGPVVPGTGQVLAWGSAGGMLYAIRAVEGGPKAVATRPVESPEPTTRPGATTRAYIMPAPASAPTTRPLTLALLRYEYGQWVGVCELPNDADTAGAFALAGAAGRPLLAVSTDNRTIHTFELVDSKWQERGDLHARDRGATFGLVTATHLPALWTIDPDNAMSLFLKHEGEPWTRAKPFTLPAVPPGAQRALAAAGQEFRLVFLKDGKFWEQRYDTSAAPLGSLNELQPPQGTHPDPILRVLYSLLLLGMVVIMLVTFYRRRAAEQQRPDDE
jgi:hypothetical protein